MENNLSGSGSQSSSVSELEKRIFPRTRKAKRVKFFRNGDKFFSGIILPVLAERYRSFDSLIADLTRALVENVTLPSGVRTVYTLDGRKALVPNFMEDLADVQKDCGAILLFLKRSAYHINDAVNLLDDSMVLPEAKLMDWNYVIQIAKVDELEDGQSYVCSGVGESFKRLDYEAIAVTPQSFRLGLESPSDSTAQKAISKISRCSQTNGSLATGNGVARLRSGSPRGTLLRSGSPVIRSHIATFIRNGTKPRKVCRLLLNKRNSQTLEQLMAAITECVKLDTGCVRKVFTQSGSPVTTLHQFFQEDVVFFTYGNERVNQEDFELDFEESKAVLQFRKSTITRTTRKGPSPGMPVKAGGAARAAAAEAAEGDAAVNLDASLMPKPLRLKYNVGDIIGEGNFAVVRVCTDKATDQKYALKVIDKRKSKGKEHYVAAEVRVMRKLCHPRIVTLYDEFHSGAWLFLVLELVSGGDLFDSIAASIKYSEPQSRLLIGHLTSAIAYLHSLSIVHRDIKPENLLVEVAPDGSIRGLKLADFGLAVEVWEPLKAICGTPTYVAPEILIQNGYGLKIDVWAAGVILYVLLCGFPPFSAPDQEKLFDAILSGRLEFPLPFWQNVSAGAIDLVANMLRPQPELRFAAEDVLDHVWMSDDYDGKCEGIWYDEDSA